VDFWESVGGIMKIGAIIIIVVGFFNTLKGIRNQIEITSISFLFLTISFILSYYNVIHIMIIENITKLICLRCGHKWYPKQKM